MVLMIGSICKGSIGICQLPRAWWNAVPRRVGPLDPSYPTATASTPGVSNLGRPELQQVSVGVEKV